MHTLEIVHPANGSGGDDEFVPDPQLTARLVNGAGPAASCWGWVVCTATSCASQPCST